MMITTLQVPRHQAWKAFQQYRVAVRARHSKEDEALMRGYRALSQGQKVLDLIQVMVEAGVDAQGRPRLAICRADAPTVFCRRQLDGAASFSTERLARANIASASYISLPPGTLPILLSLGQRWQSIECRAVVPTIPPPYRPAHALSGYHILWEAAWQGVPHDPFLLKRLATNLYVVLAQWDLTPLEQAVLRSRAE